MLQGYEEKFQFPHFFGKFKFSVESKMATISGVFWDDVTDPLQCHNL